MYNRQCPLSKGGALGAAAPRPRSQPSACSGFPIPSSLDPSPYSLIPSPYSLIPSPYSLVPSPSWREA